MEIFGTVFLGIMMSISSLSALELEQRMQGFVYLHEIDPRIRQSVRYATDQNFTAKPVAGYTREVVILTKQAACALANAQKQFLKDGYSLVVYDAYRPQRATDCFMSWSKDIKKQSNKKYYYPDVDKKDVFILGYVCERSGHSRGSTLDVTLIKLTETIHDIVISQRVLLDGTSIYFLDDGTLDMGSSFDLFGEVSHSVTNLITAQYQERRDYLKKIMRQNGFKHYSNEWWHFSLIDEPYSADKQEHYFDFIVN